MKKGKKIWNRLLSLVLCLVMVTGMFVGMGMEVSAVPIPDADSKPSNGGSVPAYTHTWILTPGNTGTEFYNRVEDIPLTGYAEIKDLTYITTSRSGQDESKGFFWKDGCTNEQITDGVYWVYKYHDSYNGGTKTRIRYEHKVTVRVGYSIGVSVSGASGGGITVNNENYNGGEIAEGSSLTFKVKDVTDYTPTVTFDGKTLSASNGTYTISSGDIKNASNRTINVKYDLTNKSTITINDPGNVTIKFNDSTDTPQTVGKSGSYNISARAYNRYLVTDILIDGQSVRSGNNTTLTLENWKPTNESHQISAKVVKKEIKAKDGTINLRDGMTAQQTAEEIFDAIHEENNINLNKNNLDTDVISSKYSCIQYSVGEYWFPYMKITTNIIGTPYEIDYREYFKNLTESTALVRIFSNEIEDLEYASNEVTLTINKIKISPAQGTLSKVYDGTPKALAKEDFKIENNVDAISNVEVSYYNEQKNVKLANAPTDAGTYYVKVKVTDSLGSNTSDFIPYEIEPRQVTIKANDQEITYGAAIVSDQNAATVNGLLDGHTLSCTITPSTTQVTTNGILTVSDVSIKNGDIDCTNNYDITSETGNLTVNKTSKDALSVEVPTEVTYNGTEQKPLVIKLEEKTLTAGTDYTVKYGNNVKVGTATITVTSSNWDGTITRTFKIVPKKITATIDKADEIYNGTAKAENAEIILNDLENTDSVSATGNISYADANVGENKTVTATNVTLVGDDAKNYQLVDGNNNPTTVLNGNGTITARPITVTANSASKTYGDADPELTWNVTSEVQVVDGEKLSGIEISRAEGENVGIYQITVGQRNGANGNYDITFAYNDAKFTIDKKELTVDVAVENKQYDGLKNATYSTVLNGVVGEDDVTLNCENVTAAFDSEEVGEAIEVALTGDFSLNGAENLLVNYTLTQPAKTGYKADIYNTYDASEYMVTPNEWTNGTVSIMSADGYLIATGNKDNSGWESKLEVSNETGKEGATITFYLRNDSTKAISLPETVTYFIDKTDPKGSITIAENKFNTFLNTITFGTFFNKTQTVTFAAEDDLSGIAKIEYYESAEGLTNEQIVNLPADAWTKGDSVNVTLEDAKKFVYYARITDKAGNQRCISSDGSVYDITYPAITGITNGETYYTTQIAEIFDTNLDEVKLNGESLTITDGKIEAITLEGNKDATYTIVAIDKAGNKTTVSITMKPLTDLSGDITENNVTLADEKELEKSEQLLKNELEKGNLSDEEKKDVKDRLTEIQNLLQEIDEVQDVIEMLDNLPDAYLEDGKTVNPYVSDRMDDEEQKLYSAVKAAYNAYNKLSAHQQSLISTGLKHNLSNLRKVLTDYRIIDGDGKVWIYDTNGTLTFTANGPVCRFENALVDGKKVPTEEMKVTKGSTVVELDAGYLYRLGLGNHTFQMEYTDGETDIVEFSIVTMEEWNTMMNQSSGVNKTGGVATGDSANILLWGAALAAGTAGIVIAKKKRKDKEA